MGINGRVLEIFHRESGEKYALKVNMTVVTINVCVYYQLIQRAAKV